jgi:GTPase
MTEEYDGEKNKNKSESAIIVGVLLSGDDPHDLADDLDELESLLKTLGIETIERVIQKRQKLSPRYLIGEGKVKEIAELAERSDCKLVVFDKALSSPQVRNLEPATNCEILDRTGVILEIFSRHARSNEAKTQVEIAQLEYMLPRMTGQWTHFQRQKGGGVQARGMGEKQIEVDRRRARERIARLHKHLESISKERMTQRKARTNELKIAVVGYTNSGKTTLMNGMTRLNTQGEDVLFATLDSSVRMLDPSTRPRILMSDTVGFIRNLPHSLVESFKSTLVEVLDADLLLHVVDVSHRNYRAHMETTESVLNEIGAEDIERMMVFNKIDQLDDPMLLKVLTSAYRGSLAMSAHEEADVDQMRDHVYKYFEDHLKEVCLAIPQDDHAHLAIVYKSCMILASDFETQGVARFRVRAAQPIVGRLEKFSVDPSEGPQIIKKEDKEED